MKVVVPLTKVITRFVVYRTTGFMLIALNCSFHKLDIVRTVRSNIVVHQKSEFNTALNRIGTKFWFRVHNEELLYKKKEKKN